MDNDLIRMTFRRDFKLLLGFDIYEVEDDLQFAFKDGFTNGFFPLFTECFKKLSLCVSTVVNNYLEGNPDKFEKPIDQYVNIFESKKEIKGIVNELLKVDNPYMDPGLYLFGSGINASFDRLFDNIVTAGQTHKFDEEFIRANLIYFEDEPEVTS